MTIIPFMVSVYIIYDVSLYYQLKEMTNELNPKYLLQGVHPELLSKIAKGEIDVVALSKIELEACGLDINGKWAGLNHKIA